MILISICKTSISSIFINMRNEKPIQKLFFILWKRENGSNIIQLFSDSQQGRLQRVRVCSSQYQLICQTNVSLILHDLLKSYINMNKLIKISYVYCILFPSNYFWVYMHEHVFQFFYFHSFHFRYDLRRMVVKAFFCIHSSCASLGLQNIIAL